MLVELVQVVERREERSCLLGAHDVFHQKAKINAPLQVGHVEGQVLAALVEYLGCRRITVVRVDEGNVAMGADAVFRFGDSAIHRREQLHVIVDASWADVEVSPQHVEVPVRRYSRTADPSANTNGSVSSFIMSPNERSTLPSARKLEKPPK